MKKIPTLFIRNPKNMSRVTREVHPDCAWVITGGGIATVKLDGTACLWRGGKLWKRYTIKKGRKPPVDFIPTGEPDPITGKQPGWTAVTDGPEDKHHREALVEATKGFGDVTQCRLAEDQTYELVGPKVQGNPYKRNSHTLLLHGDIIFNVKPPRDFDGLRDFLARQDIEGIVWHHPDGMMAKIKRKDFGLAWPVKEE